ncbi:hypothetical protein [uncultured Erythrobacter sp.]|uniref:hypothetical protein n=1 Tax=uncultured Erythrobacter sp. TaxID=263913 RepID=UPI002617ABC7|nr:hypothetical protein [uncultured Erythrobacter sp.]
MKSVAVALPFVLLASPVAAKETFLRCQFSERPDLPVSVVIDDERMIAHVRYGGSRFAARLNLTPEEAQFTIEQQRMVWRISRLDLAVSVTIKTFEELIGTCQLADPPARKF